MVESIKTERLLLIPLSKSQLKAYLDDVALLEQQLGCSVSRAVLTERAQRAIQMKINKMGQSPLADHAWYTYWLMVTSNPQFGAGLIGFKGIKDGKQEVEIGYGIDPAIQNQGYTTEAVKALIQWAFEDPECQCILARNTARDNLASLRVLEKLGFRIYAENNESICLRRNR